MYLPLRYWFYIIKNYLPNHERYRFLFVNYDFYCFIKKLEKLPKTDSSKFSRKKFYFVCKNDFYFFGDSIQFSIGNTVKNQFQINNNILILKYLFKPEAKFIFGTANKQEIIKFFRNYSMPIHHLELCDTLTFPKEIGYILRDFYRFSPTLQILWILGKDSPLKYLRNQSYIIKKIFFYPKEIKPDVYAEIYDRIYSLCKLLARSYATFFVLKCYDNLCIVDIIQSNTERMLPQIKFF